MWLKMGLSYYMEGKHQRVQGFQRGVCFCCGVERGEWVVRRVGFLDSAFSERETGVGS
jgi:hypothetical protein